MECPTHSVVGQFQGRGEVRRDTGRFLGGVEYPLVQGGTDAEALGPVFDDDEAEEAASGGEAGAHGVYASEHAIETEGHVLVLGECGDGRHALGGSAIGGGGVPPAAAALLRRFPL